MKGSSLFFLLSVALFSGTAFSDIHQWTDANGTVHFSDTAPAGVSNAKKIDVRETNIAIQSEMNTGGSRVTSSGGQYNIGTPVLAVTSPSDGEIIRSNEGAVTVSGTATNVMPGSKVDLLLDGKPVAEGANNLSASLTNVDRGTHTVEVRVTSNSGKVIKSRPVSFTLQRYHKNGGK
jgi:hypothetical protein